jgi:DNA-directed RNA polymerase subunit alpha
MKQLDLAARLQLRVDLADFCWSVRLLDRFAEHDVVSLGDLARRSEKELLSWSRFGCKSLKEVKEVLNEYGLHLGMPVPEQP